MNRKLTQMDTKVNYHAKGRQADTQRINTICISVGDGFHISIILCKKTLPLWKVLRNYYNEI